MSALRNFKLIVRSLYLLFMPFTCLKTEASTLLNDVREIGVAAIANGCVNTITGDFVDSSVDIVIPGSEPLTLTRFYASSSYDSNGYYNGWCHNHQSSIEFSSSVSYSTKKFCLEGTYKELSGHGAVYVGKINKPTQKTIKSSRLRYDPAQAPPGQTNCGSGLISARNNPKNTSILYDLHHQQVYVDNGSGSKLTFTKLPRSKQSDYYSFGLTEEVKPNGLRLVLERNKQDLVSSVQLRALHDNNLIGSLTFNLPRKKDMRNVLEFSVGASDGRKIIYKMDELKCTVWNKHDAEEERVRRFLIKHAIRPNAPWEKYEYNYRRNPLMTKRIRPDGRFLDIEYYMDSEELVEKYKVDTRKNPYRKQCVKRLLAPVGCDEKPIRTHLFFYHVDNPKNEEKITSNYKKSGYTEVFDAYTRKTTYAYNNDNRLIEIKKHTGNANHQPYSKESFVWGDQKSDEPGYIQARFFSDAANNIHNARTFTYDGYGNIIRDTFYGNISGHSPPIAFNGRAPHDNGCERYNKSYGYSQSDVRHLMTEEIEDNGKGTLFGYHPGTDLIAYKFLTENGTIKIRHFFEHDWTSAIRETIIDNGSSRDKNDLTGVTERRITLSINRDSAPIGLPREVIEKYVDIPTGKEIQLKRTVNDHSIEGYLRSQQVYDANNQLAYTLNWEYDTHGNVLCEKNALGDYVTRKYDENDNLIYEENTSHNRQIFHTYDFSNRLIKTEENHADGTRLVTSHTYDYLNNRTSTTDPQGNRTDFAYDDLSRLKQTTYPSIPDQNGNLIPSRIASELDIAGNATVTYNQRDERTQTSYNVYGKPTSIHHPDGTHESFEYNLDSTIKKSVAKNGTYTLYKHDCFGRLLEKATYSAQNELLHITTSIYNAFHLISTTDPEGLKTSYTYDGAGRVKSMSKGDRLTEYAYDALGRISETKDRYSNDSYRLKKQKYDLLNRAIEEQIVEGKTGKVLRETSCSYDADGNITRQTVHNDGGTATTFTTFNALKMPIKCTGPDGNVSHFIYNYSAKNIYGQTVVEITSIDALGNQIITTMNALNKPGMIVKKNAMGQLLAKKEMFYNRIGDVEVVAETVITPNAPDKKIFTRWAHTALHQVYDIVEAVGTKEQKHSEMRFNNLGQMISIIKPDGTAIHHEYDKNGRLSHFYASNKSFDYTYTYDRNDNPIHIEDLLNNTSTVRTYNALGRLESEQLGSGYVIRYTYDALDRPTTITLPDQSGIAYTYDASNLKKVIRLTPTGQATYEHNYVDYDLSGNVTKTNLSGKAGHETNHFDIHGRLKDSATSTWSETITYDVVGNLIKAKITDPGLPVECNYTYDDMYQLTSETGTASHKYVCDSLYNCVSKDGVQATINSLNQLLSQGNAIYTYNQNGNRIEKDENGQKTFYAYDAQDRLISVIEADSKWTYIYDSFNRRLAKWTYTKSSDDWTLSSEISYLYQGQNEVGSCDSKGKIQELRLLGVGKGAEIGATVAIELNDKAYAPLHDHNGNIVNLIDIGTGEAVERYRYSAFGEEQIYDQNGNSIKESSIGNPWRFSSKRVDAETGFVYFGRRYYDPTISRWISPDPLGFDGGPNLYAYVLNNPLTHIDLYGLIGEATFSKPFFSFSGLMSSISQFFSRLPFFSHIGRVIEGLGQHLIPIPYAESCVRSIGGFLAGDGLNWAPSVNRHADIFQVGNKDYTNGKGGILVSPGVVNDHNDARAFGQEISNMHGGQRVNVFSSDTKGMATDLLSVGAMKMGANLDMVNKMASELKRMASTLDHITCYVHSRGGSILNEALKQLNDEQRGKITAYTYGSATLIDHRGMGLGGGRNVVSCGDCIPFIADVPGYCKAMVNKNSSTTFTRSNSWPLVDHSFKGAYGKELQYDVKDFNKRYGIGNL